MFVRVAVCAALASAVVVSTTGCRGLEERFTPPPKVVTEEATVAADGASVVGDLSEQTPEGLPLWPGATVTESIGTEDAYGLSLTTTDPYGDVLSGVAVGFENAGWAVAKDASSTETTGSALLSVSSEGFGGFVTITDIGDGTTQIDYTITAAE